MNPSIPNIYFYLILFFRGKSIIGPSLPPGLTQNTPEKDKDISTMEELSHTKPKRIFGPSKPPLEVNIENTQSFIRSRSRSPPPFNEKTNILNREPWMTEVGEIRNTPNLSNLLDPPEKTL